MKRSQHYEAAFEAYSQHTLPWRAEVDPSARRCGMSVDRSKYDEVWVESGDGQAMCALINGDLGWLMYLREPGDAGFSSRNPKYEGPPDATLDFFLSNGQRDYYPRAWALPIEEVRQALDYFERERKPPPFITWHNDSEDGTVIGATSD
jgi:hypothetical protein